MYFKFITIFVQCVALFAPGNKRAIVISLPLICMEWQS